MKASPSGPKISASVLPIASALVEAGQVGPALVDVEQPEVRPLGVDRHRHIVDQAAEHLVLAQALVELLLAILHFADVDGANRRGARLPSAATSRLLRVIIWRAVPSRWTSGSSVSTSPPVCST